MAQSCFLADAGVAPAMPKTIEIRPERARHRGDQDACHSRGCERLSLYDEIAGAGRSTCINTQIHRIDFGRPSAKLTTSLASVPQPDGVCAASRARLEGV